MIVAIGAANVNSYTSDARFPCVAYHGRTPGSSAASSPPAGPADVSHRDMVCSSRVLSRDLGCLCGGRGRDARGRIDDVRYALDAPDSEVVVVDLVQRAHDLAD